MAGPLQVILGIAVLGWVLYNQLRVRQFSRRRPRIAAVLGAIGLVEVATAAAAHPVSVVGWTLLVTGLVLGAALGLVRAATVKIWVRDGAVYTQGHALTAALWIVGIGVHIGLDVLARVVDPAAESLNTSSVLLFIAVSLGVQGLMTMRRVQSLPGAPSPVGARGGERPRHDGSDSSKPRAHVAGNPDRP